MTLFQKIVKSFDYFLDKLPSNISVPAKKRRRTSSFLREQLEQKKIKPSEFYIIDGIYKQIREEKYLTLENNIEILIKKWENTPINGEIFIDVPQRTKDNIISIYNDHFFKKIPNNEILAFLKNENIEFLTENLKKSPWLLFFEHVKLSIKDPLSTDERVVNIIINQCLSANQSLLDLYQLIVHSNYDISDAFKKNIYKYLTLTEQRLLFMRQNYNLLYNRYDVSVEDPEIRKNNLFALQELYFIYSKTHKFFKMDKTWNSLIPPLKEFVIELSKKKITGFENRNAIVLECLQIKSDCSIFLVLMYQYLKNPQISIENQISQSLTEKVDLYKKILLAYNKPIIDMESDLEITKIIVNQKQTLNLEMELSETLAESHLNRENNTTINEEARSAMLSKDEIDSFQNII